MLDHLSQINTIGNGEENSSVPLFEVTSTGADSFAYALLAPADNCDDSTVFDLTAIPAATSLSLNGSYKLCVKASDSVGNPDDYLESAPFTRAGNQAPTDISISAASIAEGSSGRTVGALSTTDPDAGDTPHIASLAELMLQALAFLVRT